MTESTTLVAVAGGDVYVRYAEQLMESAREFFKPTSRVEYVTIGVSEQEWPLGTLMRYHHLLAQKITTDYLFMVDADMLCVAPIGAEILPSRDNPNAIVVTQHPGYVDLMPGALPFEDREESACYVPLSKRSTYYCGGFVGGERLEFQDLARMITKRIDEDLAHGIIPKWNDESALNCAVTRYLGSRITLSPSYCYPENPAWYKTFWPNEYEPKIVAVDKPHEHREGREVYGQ